MGMRGYIKEGLELTPMSSLTLSKGASTPDLIVAEFRNGCRQTDLASAYVLRPLNRLVLVDLASACVLCPLNHLVLDFEVGVDSRMNEWRSGGIPDWRWWRGLTVRGGVRTGNINGT